MGRFDPNSQGQSGPRDRLIAERAARQHGVITRSQLKEMGVGRKAIDYWLGTGRLHQLYRGVYAVGHTALSGRGHLIAAVLSAGAHAVLSHRSAALVWDILEDSRSVVDVSTPDRGRTGNGRVKVHRVRALRTHDVDEIDAVPLTSIARTIIDVAATEPARRVRRALDEAERKGLLDTRAFDHYRGRKGYRRVMDGLADMAEPPDANPGLERLLFELCHEENLPRPEMNVLVRGRLVDALWRKQKLIGELDSRAYHMHTRAFEEDRARDVELQLEYRVIRITWRMLTRERRWLVAMLRKHLAV